MEVQELIRSMEEVCSQREMLTHYRNDLLIHDRAVIERLPTQRYVWVVSLTSSDVYPIAVHPRAATWLEATLNARQKVLIFLVDAASGRIKEIDAAKAMALIREPMQYSVKGREVLSRHGELSGYLDLKGDFDWRTSRTYVSWRYEETGSALPQGMWLSLAMYEAETRFGMWFSLDKTPENVPAAEASMS